MFVQSGKLVLTRSKPFCHTQSGDDDEEDDDDDDDGDDGYGDDDDDVDDVDFNHIGQLGHGQTLMLVCLLSCWVAKSLTLLPYLLFDTFAF